MQQVPMQQAPVVPSLGIPATGQGNFSGQAFLTPEQEKMAVKMNVTKEQYAEVMKTYRNSYRGADDGADQNNTQKVFGYSGDAFVEKIKAISNNTIKRK